MPVGGVALQRIVHLAKIPALYTWIEVKVILHWLINQLINSVGFLLVHKPLVTLLNPKSSFCNSHICQMWSVATRPFHVYALIFFIYAIINLFLGHINVDFWVLPPLLECFKSAHILNYLSITWKVMNYEIYRGQEFYIYYVANRLCVKFQHQQSCAHLFICEAFQTF